MCLVAVHIRVGAVAANSFAEGLHSLAGSLLPAVEVGIPGVVALRLAGVQGIPEVEALRLAEVQGIPVAAGALRFVGVEVFLPGTEVHLSAGAAESYPAFLFRAFAVTPALLCRMMQAARGAVAGSAGRVLQSLGLDYP